MTYPGTLGALEMLWDARLSPRSAFEEARRLYLAYGEDSWTLAMKMKGLCHCPPGVLPHEMRWDRTLGRKMSNGCQEFRFWSAVELILDCHRYGDSTGVAS